jgi:hypothetical protein
MSFDYEAGTVMSDWDAVCGSDAAEETGSADCLPPPPYESLEYFEFVDSSTCSHVTTMESQSARTIAVNATRKRLRRASTTNMRTVSRRDNKRSFTCLPMISCMDAFSAGNPTMADNDRRTGDAKQTGREDLLVEHRRTRRMQIRGNSNLKWRFCEA